MAGKETLVGQSYGRAFLLGALALGLGTVLGLVWWHCADKRTIMGAAPLVLMLSAALLFSAVFGFCSRRAITLEAGKDEPTARKLSLRFFQALLFVGTLSLAASGVALSLVLNARIEGQ